MGAKKISPRVFIFWITLSIFLSITSWFLVKYLNALFSQHTSQVKLVNLLIKGLNDTKIEVKATSAHALGKIGNHSAASALIKALENDDEIFDICMDSLKKMGIVLDYSKLEEMPKAFDEGWIEGIERKTREFVLSSSKVVKVIARFIPFIVLYAIFVILQRLINKKYQIGSRLAEYVSKSNPKLAKRIMSATFHFLIILITFTLVQLYYSKIMTEPIKPGTITEFHIKLAKVEMAGRLKVKSAIPILSKALLDLKEDIRIRWRAAYSLGRIGSIEANDALVMSLEDPDTRIRQYSIWALGNIHSRKGGYESEVYPLIVKFCNVCGESIRKEDKFCRKCGAKIERVFEKEEDK